MNASTFLTAIGKHVQLKPEKVSDRPEEILFFRFSYNLDPSSIDPRIVQKPTFFSFCLRLPQHRYFSKEDRVEEIYSSVSKQLSSKTKSKISGIIGVSQKLFTTPDNRGKEDGSSDDDDDNLTVTPNTPKMNILFSNMSNAKIGYYGDLGFLDKQDEFDKCVDENPVLSLIHI